MNSAIIVAGGKGLRMNTATRKQYLLLDGIFIISHTLMAFDTCPDIDRIYLVIPQDDHEFVKNTVLPQSRLQKPVSVVAGGAERQASVYNGIMAAAPGTDIAVIHDGVRPFAGPELISECINGALSTGACIPGTDAVDTVKTVDDSGCIEKTLDRTEIRLAQTPQAFRYDLVKYAHEKALSDNFQGTDDASLVEYIGGKVRLVQGSRLNIKITSKEDLVIAEAIFRSLKR